jgi:hypothetical protein
MGTFTRDESVHALGCGEPEVAACPARHNTNPTAHCWPSGNQVHAPGDCLREPGSQLVADGGGANLKAEVLAALEENGFVCLKPSAPQSPALLPSCGWASSGRCEL